MNCQCRKSAYINFEEKKIFVDTPKALVVEDINSLKNVIAKYNNGRYIFRGVKDASYKLFSSLHYYMLTRNVSSMHGNYPDFISDQLFSLFSNNCIFDYFIKCQNPIETITQNNKPVAIFSKREVKHKLAFYFCSLLQHYSGKTPFVDFTKDINIALFFCIYKYKMQNNLSINDIEDYVSIYVLPSSSLYLYNNDWIELHKREKDNSICWEEENIREYLHDEINNRDNCNGLTSFIDNLLFLNKISWVDYDDFLFNENLIAQKGSFVIYQNLSDKPLEERYYETYNSKITCIEIHKKLIPEITKSILEPSNITESTMFPNINNIVTLAFHNAVIELNKK
jgi:hypothetical protein